ncbi:hypothetical protein BCR35DRAFT_307370 [Leucosporidium creatinivorum]|uniref:Peroxisomal biogenesis factor 11 n=1 Tax=Leucosporidium creatinivorum TaxID=106004 RepID=A0A1Y2ENK3_9BASI|nr:hypothetical protein BCR35DRAFT_307370 [Leucosporidium creatinivorum]
MARPSAAAHLSHFLRTTSTPLGADKVWMLLEYSLEAGSIGLLSKRFGGKQGRRRRVGEQMQKLGMAISTARVLYRLMDTLAMIDWLNHLYATSNAEKGKEVDNGGEEAAPSEDGGSLVKLEKAQAWSMLLCASSEATAYLALIGALRIKERRANWIMMWSARFWALFTFFQMLHSLRARHLLRQEQQAYLTKTAPLITLRFSPPLIAEPASASASEPISSASSDSGVGLLSAEEGVEDVEEKEMQKGDKVEQFTQKHSEKREEQEKEQEVAVSPTEFEATMAEFATRRKNLRDGLGEQMGIFPLTLHWSMGETLFPAGSAYVGVLGTISALFGISKGWRETA